MKIAGISDIHGNLHALEAVLEDMETQNIDKIFICGDLALMGVKPEQTVDKIIELINHGKAVAILGNTDEMIINDNEILRPDQIEFLKILPVKRSIKVGALEILLVHGSPRRIDENISPDIDESILKEIVSRVKEDIIFCGHTHLPAVHEIDGKTIVNNGSVGRPFTKNPDACYSILDYPDLNTKEFSISHRFVNIN